METQRMKLTKGNVRLDSLPLDLMMEILKRLPVKTLIQFLSVSKLWASIIRSRDFMRLYLIVSLTRPRGLIFLFRHGYCGLDFSSVLPQNTHESSSLTTFHVSCHTAQWTTVAPSVHGLICYGQSTRLMIYNPCTRRSITLPEIDTWRRPIRYYLGHDPIDNDYKVLGIMAGWRYDLVEEIRVLTVGTESSWKMIENNIIPHASFGQELCISGVLYYQAFTGTKMNDLTIISFDIRSEKLCPIKGPCTFQTYTFRRNKSSKLTSYEGKLAVIFFRTNLSGGSVVTLCVLEDAAKEEWSNKTFFLPITIPPGQFRTTETNTGEIIFAPKKFPASVLELVYYDMKTNCAKTVNIRGITKSTVYSESVSSNLVENLMFL